MTGAADWIAHLRHYHEHHCRGKTVCPASKRTILRLKALTRQDEALEISALIVRRLHIQTPRAVIPVEEWPHLKNLSLADPSFNTPSPVVVLLGANVYGEILMGNIRRGLSGQPVAQETRLGWIVAGSAFTRSTSGWSSPRTATICSTFRDRMSLSEALQRFWELDEPVRKARGSLADAECERLFIDGHQRSNDGRYIVRLPRKITIGPQEIGNTLAIAQKALISTQRRMTRDPHYQEEYESFMYHYENLGHMRLLEPSETETRDLGVCYLAHHGIWQNADPGPKLRVVFDASRHSNSGRSLNELLLTGPALQADLIAILLRWRQHRIVFSADIQMMYRQIRVSEADRDLQRIVWQRRQDSSPQHFQLLTLTYGMCCAPYLALRTLKQLALDEGSRYPAAAHALLHATYVDDILTGASDVLAARKLRAELIQLLKAGGFPLKKWASNHPALIEDLDQGERLRPAWRDFQTEGPIQTLGVSWDPTADQFRFRVPEGCDSQSSTKRQALGVIARLFDPAGWLSPVSITAKIMMQELWRLQLSWDERLPPLLLNRWTEFREQLRDVINIQIPRWLGTNSTSSVILHGFADASQQAYAAAVYVAIPSQGLCNLLIARTKVAPLKTLSVPKLELSAALLLTRLLNRVINEFEAERRTVHAWTDSQIVLAWLRSDPSRWNVFVANRVSEIQREIPSAVWHHVPSNENPADLATRGISPLQLRQSTLWWNGPEWAARPESNWPTISTNTHDTQLETRSPVCLAAVITPSPDDFMERFSSLTRLERIVARCLRLFRHWHQKGPDPHGPLSCRELNDGYLRCARICQGSAFAEEITSLLVGQRVAKRSPLRALTPFLDDSGIIRVGGRIQDSHLSYDERHPVILPRDCWLSNLVIRWAHQSSLHGGVALTYSCVMRRAWIIGGRQRVRAYVRRCMKCARAMARPMNQLMGNLPEERVAQSRPFSKCGLDYAGPFQLKCSRGRGIRTSKGYLAIFVCLATKAVHMEVVGDLTTESFLAAMRRFSGRRGLPVEVWSDNATTFHGADAALRSMFREAHLSWNHITTALSAQGIQWKFIPPAAPHFGGLWEAAVKSAKSHMKRVIGPHPLTYEEFTTLVVQIEQVMNSRPLTPFTGCPEDRDALTPGHFLIGSSLLALPEPVDFNKSSTHLQHWRLVQSMFQHFWMRWSREYLHTLQQRTKWQRTRANLQEGDLVLLLDPALLSGGRWPLGRVLAVHPGKDTHVRAATVQTSTGTYQRPITKLAPLPISDSPPAMAGGSPCDS